MKRTYFAILALAASGFAANAQDVMPTAVKFVDGAIKISLSGVAGDAAKGREIVGSKKI